MATLLKDLYSIDFLTELAQAINRVEPTFSEQQFINDCLVPNWADLKLMERRDQITVSLHQQLPADFSAAATILRQIGPQFHGLAAIVLPNYVATYGLADWDTSMATLALLTQYSSAEFAIRPFLVKYPEATSAQMVAWSYSQQVDQRRLASEGMRPRLPWGIRLQQFVADPQPVMPVLTRLLNDSEVYVQKSVANNLNDISKDHPQLVLDFCQQHWNESETGNWVLQRGLRTLFKQGQPEVLQLLGYQPTAAEQLTTAKLTVRQKKAALETASEFNYQLQATGAKTVVPLYLGYRIHYVRQNGQTSAKDFFIKRLNLKPGQLYQGQFKIKWQQLTTRKLYAGDHLVELLVNTEPTATIQINLTI
ncbi:DNA alkylation repair protein [Lapidilactobacillus wuchangensis]|uniref:DNA alkylation repair protein n=1 Tax=Lapidilactobacillus wuchangensis TaxID=2486001 RepID=UPI000F793FE0|nr:DNA alkylation repair protein [Lapidilactobacillus wuchangensis]